MENILLFLMIAVIAVIGCFLVNMAGGFLDDSCRYRKTIPSARDPEPHTYDGPQWTDQMKDPPQMDQITGPLWMMDETDCPQQPGDANRPLQPGDANRSHPSGGTNCPHPSGKRNCL